MGSSRTENEHSGDALLQEMGEAYRKAADALNSGELADLRAIIQGIDTLVNAQNPRFPLSADPQLLAEVRSQHGRLLAQLSSQRDECRKALRHSQQGKRALRGYGQRSFDQSRRHDSVS